MIYFGFQVAAFQKSVNMSGPQGPAGPALPLEGLAGRLASLSKQLGPPIGPLGPQLPPCPTAPSLSTVGQSHPKPVVPNVEYQRSLNSLASSIHSTPSTLAFQPAGSQHQLSRSHSNPSTPALPPSGSSSNRQASSSSHSQVPSPFLEPPQRPRPPTAAEVARPANCFLIEMCQH